MKPLIPSQELALKKLLLALRQNYPATPAITIAAHSDYDREENMQVHYVELKLPGTDFFCRIFDDGVRAYPAGQGLEEGSVDVRGWQARLNYVGEWADKAILERAAVIELREIDKQFGDDGVSAYAEAPDGEMFTDTERAQIDVDLMAVASQIGLRFDSLKDTLGAMNTKLGAMDAKLDKLAEQEARILAALENLRVSSDKISKKDWSLLALGTAASMAVSTVVPPEVAQAMVQDFLGQLAHIKLLPPAT